jgi:hypothetical protein
MLASLIDEPARVTPARLEQGREVAQSARRVRQARGLCAARQSRPARQARRRLSVSRELALRGARRLRRTKLRQEGRELGSARGRQTQSPAQRRRGDGGPATGGLTSGRAAVGRDRRAPRAYESRGDSAARDMEQPRAAAIAELTAPAITAALSCGRVPVFSLRRTGWIDPSSPRKAAPCRPSNRPFPCARSRRRWCARSAVSR